MGEVGVIEVDDTEVVRRAKNKLLLECEIDIDWMYKHFGMKEQYSLLPHVHYSKDIEDFNLPYNGQLRVWWTRNGRTTYYHVSSIREAIDKQEKLADDDLEDPNVDWNAGGLQVFNGEDWEEYYDEQGRDIDDIMCELGLCDEDDEEDGDFFA